MEGRKLGIDDDMARDPSPRPWVPISVLVTGALLLGVALRVIVHFSARALWIDEAMIALNLVERDIAGLLEPLDWDQGAPVLWLLLMRAVVVLGGTGELVLRLPAFVAGVFTLPLLWHVARKHVGRLEALLTLTIMALLPLHVYQSSELKPYATDALATVLCLWAFATAARWLRGLDEAGLPVDLDDDWRPPGLPTRGLVGLLALGAALPWLSLPSVFVLAGGGTALMLGELVNRRWRSLFQLAMVCGAWFSSFLGHFVLQRTLLANDNLQSYWKETEAFAPLPPESLEDLRVLVELAVGLFVDPGRSPFVDVLAVGPRTGLVLAVAALVGLAVLCRKDKRMCLLALLPIVFGFVASGFEAFPMQGRLLTFWTPLLALLVGAGLAEAFRRARPGGRLLGWALFIGAMGGPLVGAAEILANGAQREEILEVLAHVRAEAQPGDVLWVYYGARPAYLFYSESTNGFSADGLQIVDGPDRAEAVADYEPALDALDGRGRVWLLFAHDHMTADGSERRHHLRHLAGLGELRAEHHARGASVHLFEL